MQTVQLLNLYKLDPIQLFSYINEKVYKEIGNKFAMARQFMHSIKDDETHDVELTTILFDKLQGNFEHLQRIEEKLVFNSSISSSEKEINIPSEMLKVKHQGILDLLAKIRSVSDNFSMKGGKSTYYNMMLNELFEIENELKEIIAIKENILFRNVQAQ